MPFPTELIATGWTSTLPAITLAFNITKSSMFDWLYDMQTATSTFHMMYNFSGVFCVVWISNKKNE